MLKFVLALVCAVLALIIFVMGIYLLLEPEDNKSKAVHPVDTDTKEE